MKALRHFIILLAVFIVGLIGFSKMMNHETKDMTTDLSEATMPVMYMAENEQRVNELHGYVGEMDAKSMRDTITPLSDDGVLSVEIDSYDNRIDELAYEVRSLDTTRLVQSDVTSDFAVESGIVKAQLKIQDLLTEGEEYLLVLTAKNEEHSWAFYTRIIKADTYHVKECLQFVDEFHDITMDKEQKGELVNYMEPSAGSQNTNLQNVNINNSLTQACWGELPVSEVTRPVAAIMELNDSYNVILLNYIASSSDEDGRTAYYNVEEYYRVRYGTQKMYLLSFERTTEEIFRGNSGNIAGKSIVLGIRSGDVDFKANEAGNVVCFVQQGELWSYNLSENKLTEVFSFRSQEGMDIRENYNEHDIRIIRADEGGSVDFIVYGYMNRGNHEGQVGISVCHYDCMTNTVEESLFIPSAVSYQVMKEEIGEMMFISESDMFYINMGEEVHQVDLENRTDEILIKGLAGSYIETSDDGRYMAWTDANDGSVLHVTDFESAKTNEITVPDDMLVRPLGFLENDCIYGLASKADVERMSAFAMKKVEIVSCQGDSFETLKSYDSGKAYVTGAVVDDGNIYLNRVKWSDGGMVPAEPDTIRNRDMQEDALIYESTRADDLKQTEVILALSGSVAETKMNTLIPKQIVTEESTLLEMSSTIAASSYYVYAKGKVCLGTDNLVEAINCADENRGVVIDQSQKYIWKRAKTASHYISESSYMALKSSSMEDHSLNVNGCTLDQVLYFIEQNQPVFSGGRFLIGYDENTISYYNPSSGEVSKVSQESFGAANSSFSVYVSE